MRMLWLSPFVGTVAIDSVHLHPRSGDKGTLSGGEGREGRRAGGREKRGKKGGEEGRGKDTLLLSSTGCSLPAGGVL